MSRTQQARSGAGPTHADAPLRFAIERATNGEPRPTIVEDVARGLALPQKAIPSKYFYDERGSQLFDAICELDEYYLTRTEQALLDRFAGDLISAAEPTDLVELGSGMSRKTRTLLDAAQQAGLDLCYHPFDVCEEALRESGRALTVAYPGLRVHAIVGDYDLDLERLPDGDRRLVAFLGSTLGNFTRPHARQFVERLGGVLRHGEHFLLGADLVKPVELIEAAYNDSAGITAEFNRNVLHVINRELDADFDPAAFEHLAFFNAEQSQIEAYLRSRRRQRVTLRKLGSSFDFGEGETIHTEISRKFTYEELEDLLEGGGFEVRRWYTPADDSFVLALAEKTGN
jgi:L-histidine N-alpha-methyltransferase